MSKVMMLTRIKKKKKKKKKKNRMIKYNPDSVDIMSKALILCVYKFL